MVTVVNVSSRVHNLLCTYRGSTIRRHENNKFEDTLNGLKTSKKLARGQTSFTCILRIISIVLMQPIKILILCVHNYWPDKQIPTIYNHWFTHTEAHPQPALLVLGNLYISKVWVTTMCVYNSSHACIATAELNYNAHVKLKFQNDSYKLRLQNEGKRVLAYSFPFTAHTYATSMFSFELLPKRVCK